MNEFYAREFWRFVVVQQYVGELAKTAIDYPPMQDPASFNLDAIKKKIEAVIRQHEGEYAGVTSWLQRSGWHALSFERRACLHSCHALRKLRDVPPQSSASFIDALTRP